MYAVLKSQRRFNTYHIQNFKFDIHQNQRPLLTFCQSINLNFFRYILYTRYTSLLLITDTNMPISESIEKSVLELDEKERLHLLVKLLESLEPESKDRSQLDKWVNEAETRYQAWKAGEMSTISEEKVIRELRDTPDDDR